MKIITAICLGILIGIYQFINDTYWNFPPYLSVVMTTIIAVILFNIVERIETKKWDQQQLTESIIFAVFILIYFYIFKPIPEWRFLWHLVIIFVFLTLNHFIIKNWFKRRATT